MRFLFTIASVWITWNAAGFAAFLSGQEPSKNPNHSRKYATRIGDIMVSIRPEKKSLMLGEPIFFEFRVKNLTNKPMYVVQGGDNRNRLGRPANYKITAVGPDGKSVPIIDAGMSFGGIMGPRKIDKDLGWSRKLFLPNWFKMKKMGTYTVKCQTKLRISLQPDFTTQPKEHDADVNVDLSFEIEVGQNRMKEMGSLINELGVKSLKGEGDAIKKLLAIEDERVVDPLIQMVKLENYSRRFSALQGLSLFTSDKALSGIEIGLNTSVKEMRKNASNDKVARQLVKNIRHSAAVALSRSPHPKAEGRLIELWNDPNEAIRITVLHRLGKLLDDESLEILQQMTLDKNERVRKEAIRYYQLRGGSKRPKQN